MNVETKMREMKKEKFLKLLKNAQLWAFANEMLINGYDIITSDLALRANKRTPKNV